MEQGSGRVRLVASTRASYRAIGAIGNGELRLVICEYQPSDVRPQFGLCSGSLESMSYRESLPSFVDAKRLNR